ncbi:ATP-binding cassette, subfamily B [Streptoalloteichus tenebrarius]|uniref:ATP-binding cassette, subfamily B n=2 Tax=Streptoalloteichus tenebrarius (strain ATCC 17920 / DSM 40477 / JCM 4838 / CBS 697.72 / NBRC 16177 / NCIMB 11028 / NRRL B-12390 / A12253. 1 / ISP 5477) TaxID=1933 RepID=A0ABT1HRK9_STRSD|nr:ATP-binding cassette, subfamily B [Streptoalloteichus tenebrarius]BFF04612.1 ABC transporter ATP-binding protein [Streptoalloteichus tenebrarius]
MAGAELVVPAWRSLDDDVRSASFWRMARDLPRLTGHALALVRTTSRRWALAVLGLQLLSGALVVLMMAAAREFFSALVASGLVVGNLVHVAPTLVGVGLVMGASKLVGALTSACRSRLGPRIEQRAELRLLGLTTRAPLELFDEPRWFDAMSRARDRGVSSAPVVVDQALALSGALVTVTAAVGAVAFVSPALAVLVLVSSLPGAWAAVRSAQLAYVSRRRTTTLRRRKWVLSDLLANRRAAPEIRANQLQDHLLGLVEEITTRDMGERLEVSRRQALQRFVGQVAGGAALCVLYLALVLLVRHDALSLASASAALVVIRSGRRSLNRAALTVRTLYEHGLYLADFFRFCSETENRAREEEDEAEPVPLPHDCATLALKGVSFTYPGSEAPSLRDVDLELRRGEIVALVGDNGSGKTTLAKLVAGLYRPGSGALHWDDVDLGTLPLSALSERVTLVAQDHTRWPLTARDNIAIGRPSREATDELVVRAARQARVDPVLSSLRHGYATLLSRQFTDGADLSGGQWQRLALARAFYRDAHLLVLDEPTASLDPRTERHVFEELRALAARGRSVLLVTHSMRMAASAHRIVVLDGGRLIEEGPHDALMEKGGKYAAMVGAAAGSSDGSTAVAPRP